MNADDYIEDLALAPHPEGGFYRETYRSDETVAANVLPERFTGDRNSATAIYYLLKQGQYSTFHRIKSDEIWHFYAGSELLIHVIDASGGYARLRLCPAIPQAVVPAGCWFAAELTEKGDFTLAGCTVSPGFDFEDFDLADANTLCQLCPDKEELIKQLTS